MQERWTARDTWGPERWRCSMFTDDDTGETEIMLGTFSGPEEPTATTCTNWRSERFNNRAEAVRWLHATVPDSAVWHRQ